MPESRFTGRDNVVFANEVSVEVHGDNFLPAYTRGDNSDVVATDSMKNFILRQAAEYEGATLEGYLAQLGRGFLDRYELMQEVRVSGRELPFSAVEVPGEEGFEPSAGPAPAPVERPLGGRAALPARGRQRRCCSSSSAGA